MQGTQDFTETSAIIARAIALDGQASVQVKLRGGAALTGTLTATGAGNYAAWTITESGGVVWTIRPSDVVALGK